METEGREGRKRQRAGRAEVQQRWHDQVLTSGVVQVKGICTSCNFSKTKEILIKNKNKQQQMRRELEVLSEVGS